MLATGDGNIPAWSADEPRQYWIAADKHERSNGRLFKEIEFSLPRELTLEQQQQLVDEFAAAVTGAERLPFSYAIHRGKNTNPHCHLMMSERVNDGHERSAETWFKRAASGRKKADEGGAKKSVMLKPKYWLENTRALWSSYANDALERFGHSDIRIDHRSFAARGIEFVPSKHIGPKALEMHTRGIDSERVEEARRIDELNEQISETITQRDAVDRELSQIRIEQHIEQRHQLQIRGELRALEAAQARLDAHRQAEIERQERREWVEWTSQPGVCPTTGRLDVESRLLETARDSYEQSQKIEAAEREVRRQANAKREAEQQAAARQFQDRVEANKRELEAKWAVPPKSDIPSTPKQYQPPNLKTAVLGPDETEAKRPAVPTPPPMSYSSPEPTSTLKKQAKAAIQQLLSVPDRYERAGIIREISVSSDEQYAKAFEDAMVEAGVGFHGELSPAAQRRAVAAQKPVAEPEKSRQEPVRGEQDLPIRGNDGPSS